eukprot:4702746-Pyramimonas_sp.AAC.3
MTCFDTLLRMPVPQVSIPQSERFWGSPLGMWNSPPAGGVCHFACGIHPLTAGFAALSVEFTPWRWGWQPAY